jgi:hypothetical protein
VTARKGVVTVRMRCVQSEPSCRIFLQLRSGRRLVGRATRKVRGGKTAVLRIRLDRRTQRALRRSRQVRLTGQVKAVDSAGYQSRWSIRLTVRKAR